MKSNLLGEYSLLLHPKVLVIFIPRFHLAFVIHNFASRIFHSVEVKTMNTIMIITFQKHNFLSERCIIIFSIFSSNRKTLQETRE